MRPFPGPGGKIRVSPAGGTQVRWRADGKELFYIARDGQLMAVPARFSPDGQALEVAAPLTLFMTHLGDPELNLSRQQYMVAPDGQRFLMNTVTDETVTAPITIVLNWKPPVGR